MEERVRRTKSGKKKRAAGRDEIIGISRILTDFHSKHLDNYRNIVIWLPPGYKKLRNADKKYPVLYMHDGQNLIDPKTSFSSKDWRVDETVVKLSKAKRMKEIIVVGIYNTPERLEEYSDSPKGELYLKFMVEELKPFIDNNYRTLPQRECTAIMGSSMGGLISFIAGWKHYDVFSMAGSMSSSFYYDNEKVFDIVNPLGRPKEKVKFYIDHGEDGLIRGQKMFCRLTELGYVVGDDVDYHYAPNAEHNESAWAERLERPLLFFFGLKE
jgi:predicted alpha/beta superfamily hydrolase